MNLQIRKEEDFNELFVKDNKLENKKYFQNKIAGYVSYVGDKKELMPEITQFMVTYNISDLNTENGKLKCSERKTKQTINKAYLTGVLQETLGDNNDKMNECLENILNNRAVKVTHVLTKCKK